MLIAPMKSGSMKDWSTVDIDVAKIMKTSVLLTPELFDPLAPAARKLIAEVIEKQNGDVADGQLNPTNMVIAGGLSTVTLVDNSHAESCGGGRSEEIPNAFRRWRIIHTDPQSQRIAFGEPESKCNSFAQPECLTKREPIGLAERVTIGVAQRIA